MSSQAFPARGRNGSVTGGSPQHRWGKRRSIPRQCRGLQERETLPPSAIPPVTDPLHEAGPKHPTADCLSDVGVFANRVNESAGFLAIVHGGNEDCPHGAVDYIDVVSVPEHSPHDDQVGDVMGQLRGEAPRSPQHRWGKRRSIPRQCRGLQECETLPPSAIPP